MEITILMWVLIALVTLGLIWAVFQIIQAFNVDTKKMSLPDRIKWTYPGWIKSLMNIEYELDEVVIILQGIPAKMIDKIKRAGIDHYVITDAEGRAQEIPSGIAIRGKDLNQTLQAVNFESSDNFRNWDNREDVRVMSVVTSDPEVRMEIMLEKYLLGLRAVHVENRDEQTLEKRRAFQDALAQIVKLLREEADYELSTHEAHASKEKWAYKLYDDLQHHPDILRIDVQKKPGFILIYTDDIVVEESGSLPSTQSREKKMFFLGKMIIEIQLIDGRDSDGNSTKGRALYFHEKGRMSTGSDHHAPHVKNDGRACLGSHEGVVARAVIEKNYLKAIQEAINFLKYANTADLWGAHAFTLPELNQQQVEEIERAKLKRAKKRSPNKSPQLSKTSKYIVDDKKEHRQLLTKLKIKYLVLDDDHRVGLKGLLITNANNINAFVEQIIQSHETVQVNATAQTGVRQLRFTTDDQRRRFVQLMLESWSGKEVNMIDTMHKQKEQAVNAMRQARLAYMKLLAGRFKAEAGMTNERIQQGLFSYISRDIYRQLIAMPDIASVNEVGERLIIITNDLYVKEAKLRPRATELRCYNLGAMRIEIDISMSSEPVRCFRQSGTLPRSDGLLQAPHVDKDGTPVWGLQELRIAELTAKLDVVSVVKETIKFLQTAKLDDARGMYVQYLPEVDILELPKLELSKKELKDRWLTERTQAEQQSSQQYEEIILNQTAGQNPAQKQ